MAEGGEVPSWSSAFSSHLSKRQESNVASFISKLQQAVLQRAALESAADPALVATAAATPRPPALKLDHQTLGLVFSHLLPRELARCKCVCREWSTVASASDMLRAMMRAWDLSALTGQPRSWSMVERTTIQHFVHKHIVCKSDSLAGLAVRFGTDVATLRRYNNITSDHSLQSRTHIYIPVAGKVHVAGRSAVFVYDELSCREFVQLLPQEQQAQDGQAGQQGAAGAQEGQGDRAGGNAHAEAERMKRMARIMARSLKVDDATATYYLEESGGDMRKAMRLAEQDAGWEVATGTAPRRNSIGNGRRPR